MESKEMRVFFFFNDTATTEIYTLSLHDALPIFKHALVGIHHPEVDHSIHAGWHVVAGYDVLGGDVHRDGPEVHLDHRSEEHTSELQSRQYIVCRLLLEKKPIYYILSSDRVNMEH